MTAPSGTDRVGLRAFDRNVPVFSVTPQTWRALIGIDLDVKAGPYPVSIDAQADGRETHTTYELRVLPRKFLTRKLHVDPSFVHPPADTRERIAREAADLQQIWRSPIPERLWTRGFLRPVAGAIASSFGTRSIYNGESRPPHSGADFRSPEGTPVHAPAGGRVVLARELYFSGNTLVIDHGLGVFSLLAHLSTFDVREGDSVAADQILGRVGATGRVTGPHLHWAMRVGGARVDPLSVLAVLGQ